MSKLIYIVEDELHIQELIKFNLEENGYRVRCFSDGDKLIFESENQSPDLYIMDIMLPGISGLELCKQIKQNIILKKIPIIILTAKSEEVDKIFGLEMGADDYITKPFSIKELIARIRAVFRRIENTFEEQTSILYAGNISQDLLRREVFKNNKHIDLSFKEFELLKMFMLNKEKILSRDLLFETIWGFDFYGETRTVDVHIRNLRKKIEDENPTHTYIETIRGVGYRFNDKKTK